MMEDTRLDNPEIIVQDERIKQIDDIVTEVKQSEEWEAVRINILQIGEAHGMKIGKEIGRDTLLVEQVCRKLRKGKVPEQIADELEEELEVIVAICKAAEAAAPEYDCEVVYRRWKDNKKSE